MRMSKFLSVVAIVTLFSLVYVYQQTEVFRLAYAGQKKLVVLEDLLEKNGILKYTIEKNTSLVRIGNKVEDSSDYQMPDGYRLIRPVFSKAPLALSKQKPVKQSLLVRIFSIKRQAEAKTISPKAKDALPESGH